MPSGGNEQSSGPNVGVSRARAHFYVYGSKVGSLWSFTNFWHFIDYEAQQKNCLMGWRATGKLSSETYKGYLLKCKKSSRNLPQNFEPQAEKSLEQMGSTTACGNNFKKTRLPLHLCYFVLQRFFCQ